MLILSLFVLQVLSTSICFDLELKGIVKVGNGFMNVLRQSARSRDPIDGPNIRVPSKNFKGPPERVGIFRTSNIRPKPKNQTKLNNTKIEKPDVLIQLMKYFQEKGTKALNYIAMKIKNDFNLKKIISPTLEIVSNDYANSLLSYYDFIKNKTHDSLFDKDSVYLDFAETSCRLLYNEEKKLLNDVVMHEDHISKDEKYRQISSHLSKIHKQTKRYAIKHVCIISDVCRNYPTFTDYFPDVIDEVLKLNDKQFRKILDMIAKHLQDNYDLFAKITEKEDRQLIIEEFKSYSNNLKSMREFLELLSTLMTHRFKIVTIGSEEFKMKAKAAKILLEIINLAVSEEGDVLEIDFDNFVKAIRYWAGGSRKEIDSVLERFINNWFRRLGFILTSNAIHEMRVLIKTIMRGNTKGDYVFRRLFNFGSLFVKGLSDLNAL